MGAFDWINENIAAPLMSAVSPEAAATGPTADVSPPVFAGDPTTPDVDRAPPMSAIAGQSASATLEGAATTSFNPLDWLFGEDEEPLKLEPGLTPNLPKPEDLIPEDDLKRLAEQEKFAEQIEGEENYDPSQGIYRKSAHRVGQGYLDPSEIEAMDPDAEVSLESEEDRMAALNAFVQNDKDEFIEGDLGTNKCGATSIMAAAMMAEGKGGVKAIVDLVGADEQMGELYRQELEKAGVLDKLDGDGKLTNEDLRMVQGMLHENLRLRMSESDRQGTNGVGTEAMQQVLNNGPIREMFEKNNMRINLIDNDGEREDDGQVRANHFVLQIGEEGSEGEMIYDPLARRDGQLVRREHELRDYHNARNSQVGGRILTPEE